MYSPKFNGLTLSLFIISTFSIQNLDASPQQITFFEKLGCSGEKNATITRTQDDLNTTWVTNSSSMHILGVWSITVIYKHGNGGSDSLSMIFNETKPPDGRCVENTEWGVDPNIYKIYYADPKGPSDMATSQLMFYTEPFFGGLQHVIYPRDNGKEIPRPVAMGSQLLFSNESWTAYPKANFVGKATHIRPVDKDGLPIDAPYDYVQMKNEFVGIVGSAKWGIHEDNEEEDSSGAFLQSENLAICTISVLTSFVFKFL